MTLRIADRVLETSTTTGTGTLTLAGAIVGFRAFSAVCNNADTVNYSVWAVSTAGVPTGEWETGLGTWNTGGTLTRSAVYASSNAGSAVDFAAGTKRVSIAVTARSLPFNDGTYEMPPPGTVAANLAALTTAIASTKPIIQFRAGEYQFGSAVSASVAGRTIRGEGAANTTLKMANSHSVDYLFNSTAGASGTVFEDLTFDGNCQNSSNIYCGMLKADHSTVTDKFTLRDLTLKNIRLYAVRLYPNSTDFIMERCRVQDVEDLMFEVNPWLRGVVRDCMFFNYSTNPTLGVDNTGPVFTIYGGSDNWIITGNQWFPHVSNGYFAIESVWNGGLAVRGMTFSNNVLDARNALNGNNYGTGVSGAFQDCVFSGNTWRNGAGSIHTCGLELIGRRNSITGNTVHNGQFAINGNVSSDALGTVISGNTFVQNRTTAYPSGRTSACISIDDGLGILIEGNSFFYEQSHINGGAAINLTAATAESIIIRDNYFSSHGKWTAGNTEGVKFDVTGAASKIIIEGNLFEKLYRGLTLEMTSATGVHVKRNYYYDNDVNLSESGGTCTQSDNITL